MALWHIASLCWHRECMVSSYDVVSMMMMRMTWEMCGQYPISMSANNSNYYTGSTGCSAVMRWSLFNCSIHLSPTSQAWNLTNFDWLVCWGGERCDLGHGVTMHGVSGDNGGHWPEQHRSNGGSMVTATIIFNLESSAPCYINFQRRYFIVNSVNLIISGTFIENIFHFREK